MGSIPVARPAPVRRLTASGGRRILALLALAVSAAAITVVVALFAWPNGAAQPSPWVALTPADEVPVHEPVRFADHRLWLVKLETGEFLALWQQDPHLGCTVPWNAHYTFRGATGWLRNPCHGQTYDLTGRCFDGPCIRGLDRFPVEVRDGMVLVNTEVVIEGPPVDPNATPVTP